jgi:hypothetical protein
MDEPACPDCRALLKRVGELETQVAELTRRLDEALRAGKRQVVAVGTGVAPQPPAQIRTCGITASGSYFGCLASNRTLG